MPPNKYGDIHYECVKCDRASVFSAVDQKLAYEERQVYIWQRRSLCGECWNERRRVERAIRDCRNRWRDDKSSLRRDTAFLKKWLSLLELYPSFGARPNRAAIAMLLKLIGVNLVVVVLFLDNCPLDVVPEIDGRKLDPRWLFGLHFNNTNLQDWIREYCLRNSQVDSPAKGLVVITDQRWKRVAASKGGTKVLVQNI